MFISDKAYESLIFGCLFLVDYPFFSMSLMAYFTEESTVIVFGTFLSAWIGIGSHIDNFSDSSDSTNFFGLPIFFCSLVSSDTETFLGLPSFFGSLISSELFSSIGTLRGRPLGFLIITGAYSSLFIVDVANYLFGRCFYPFFVKNEA